MDAYLELIAFRGESEPWDLHERVAERIDHDGTWFSTADLEGGRRFLERWSLPLAQLDRNHVRKLIAQLGYGRSAATEGRRWPQIRAVPNWWRDAGPIETDLTSRLGVIRGTSGPRLGDDEAIPDEPERRFGSEGGVTAGWVVRDATEPGSGCRPTSASCATPG